MKLIVIFFLINIILPSYIVSIDCDDSDKYTKACSPTTTPLWPDQFEQSFKEQFKYPLIGKSETKGKFFYDWINKSYRVDRENGKYDRYCGTVYAFRNTPCSHIVNEGHRYLYFPDKDYCCYCCSNEHGCGILSPNWLSGANFEDYVTETDGVIYEKWNKPGLQNNFYYTTAKDRIMRRIDQQPNDIQEFDVDSFRNSISNPFVLTLPSKCKKEFTCPLLSTCTVVRYSAKKVNFLNDDN